MNWSQHYAPLADSIGLSALVAALPVVMGKIINAQSIAVASAAIGGQKVSPDAGTILRAVFWHSIALGTLMGIFSCSRPTFANG